MKITYPLFLAIPALAITLLLMPCSLRAGEDDAACNEPLTISNFAEWPGLTGDWGGGRTCLREKAGIDLIVNYTIDFAGNPVGGKLQAARQASSTFAAINLDWSRWTKALDGFEMQVSMIWRFGSDLSLEAIGNIFDVQQDYGGYGVIFYDLWIKKSFDEGRYTIRIGRITQTDDFAYDRLFDLYVTGALNNTPYALNLNSPMLAAQWTTWGAVAHINPVDEWYLNAGVYGADTRLSDPAWHGVYLGFDFNEGAFMIAQTGYLLNRGKNDGGLTGAYSIGGYYCTGKSQIYNKPAGTMRQGIPGVYLMIDQEIYRFGKDRERWIKAWATATIGPENISMMPYFAGGGVILKGFSKKRPDDMIISGVAWGKISPALALQERNAGQPPQSYEVVLELDYWIQATEFFYFEPDIQVIFNPGGAGNIPNALVVGFQSGINL